MVTVKLLKPYYIKTDEQTVRVVLAYQYFTLLINQRVFQFIPIEEKEIRVSRENGKIENIHDRFAFQNGKTVIYMSLVELISAPNFLNHLHSIAQPYIQSEETKSVTLKEETEQIIKVLEERNLKRMIDQALDERNKVLFDQLVKLL
ncbi:IDEAL domain-containing protein [Virgibacillus soli]|uniref:IDEAL domain-containing protein n=1 Tax=Paracerasibacillus soli TaxID=480284 RepID=A0ABU5CRE6_9BACI|nr:IDEAL domain-containing protein [Virgibacillus soli]MDY0408949.1 IDEAL domain-containing protein [Virgibacillus soli]